MRMKTTVLTAAFAGWAAAAFAHCDTMDGPVVADAKTALEKNDAAPALKWVPAGDEGALRAAFARASTARGEGPAAREAAETHFFETAVRLHRAGEGEPFTGLKPSGTPGEPGLAEADAALREGSADALASGAAERVEREIRERFRRVAEAAKHKDHSVDAGRAYVAAYVDYVHYVAALYGPPAGHAAHAVAPRGPNHESHKETH